MAAALHEGDDGIREPEHVGEPDQSPEAVAAARVLQHVPLEVLRHGREDRPPHEREHGGEPGGEADQHRPAAPQRGDEQRRDHHDRDELDADREGRGRPGGERGLAVGQQVGGGQGEHDGDRVGVAVVAGGGDQHRAEGHADRAQYRGTQCGTPADNFEHEQGTEEIRERSRPPDQRGERHSEFRKTVQSQQHPAGQRRVIVDGQTGQRLLIDSNGSVHGDGPGEALEEAHIGGSRNIRRDDHAHEKADRRGSEYSGSGPSHVQGFAPHSDTHENRT